MTGIRIDGNKVAQSVKERVKSAVLNLREQGITPCLATILVGDDQASFTYVRNKHKACAEVGITTQDHKLSANITQKELDELIKELNTNDIVHGILMQLPLPSHLDEYNTILKISPLKDVDGLTPYNAGLLAAGKSALVACTPLGIIEMLDYYNIELSGKHVVLINRSRLVGRPLYNLLLQRDATVTTCHSKTTDISAICKTADIIITAIGNRAKFILEPDMIQKDAIVIDVAISKENGKLVGDTNYEGIIKKAKYVTPVPGGVGPMTVAMLLKNTITAASLNNHVAKS